AGGWWFWSQTRAWHDALAAGERAQAEARFTVLREAFKRDEIPESVLGPAAHVALATGYFRLTGDADAARRILNGVEQPAPVTDATSGHDDSWSPFHERFALNRVLGMLGDERPLHKAVPDL